MVYDGNVLDKKGDGDSLFIASENCSRGISRIEFHIASMSVWPELRRSAFVAMPTLTMWAMPTLTMWAMPMFAFGNAHAHGNFL